MEDYDTRILVDAKAEYTKELTRILKKHFFEGIDSLFGEAIEACQDNYNNVYIIFQDYLSGIPKWNQDTIERETSRIIECSECEFLEDLVTAVFISHTKILAAIRINKNNKKINLNIPKIDHFIHKCYIEMAREFWKAPTYFNKKINNYEIQRNNKIIEDIIINCINETIRKMLPLKHILKESLGDQYDESDNSDNEDIQKNISKSDEKNLQRLVKKEIESLNNAKNMSSLSDFEAQKYEDPTVEPLEEKKIDLTTTTNNQTGDNMNLKFDDKDSSSFKQQGGNSNVDLFNDLNKDNSNNLNDDLNQEKIISLNKPLSSTLSNDVKTDSDNLSFIAPINTSNDTIDISSNTIDMSSNNLFNDQNKVIEVNDSNSLINTNNNNDLNELDLSSLSTSSDVLKVDNNFNLVSNTDNIYNNLNSDQHIKTEVANDLEQNKPKNDNFVFFDDAPEVETL